MKHNVTHVASVLSAASVTGAQMAIGILSFAPPCPCLLGDVVCDDVLLTALTICQHIKACFQLPLVPLKWGSRQSGRVSGSKKTFILWRMDICIVSLQRSGLGAYCSSNISETLKRQQWWNPGTSTQLCQTPEERCQSGCLNPYRPFLCLPHTYTCLILTHCVSSSNSPLP